MTYNYNLSYNKKSPLDNTAGFILSLKNNYDAVTVLAICAVLKARFLSAEIKAR